MNQDGLLRSVRSGVGMAKHQLFISPLLAKTSLLDVGIVNMNFKSNEEFRSPPLFIIRDDQKVKIVYYYF